MPAPDSSPTADVARQNFTDANSLTPEKWLSPEIGDEQTVRSPDLVPVEYETLLHLQQSFVGVIQKGLSDSEQPRNEPAALPGEIVGEADNGTSSPVLLCGREQRAGDTLLEGRRGYSKSIS
jgi:hypothetical protein